MNCDVSTDAARGAQGPESECAMSRIRSVHPGFFSDEDLVTVSAFARLLYIGILVEADDKGVFPWKPLTLKMRVLPVDNVDMEALLSELEAINAIRRYQMDGKEYGAVRNFRKFQRPKSPNDVHPIPDDFRNYVGLTDADGEKSFQREEGGDKMEDGEEEGGERDSPPADKIVAAWNLLASRQGLPAIQKMTDKRKTSLRSRIKEHGAEVILKAIAGIEDSDFLLGRNDRGWKANFDFLLQPSSMTKLIEGAYHGRTGKRSAWLG